MPQCIDCGAETPREDLFGAPDELRCQRCANKKYEPFRAPRRAATEPWPPFVSYFLLGLAVVVTLAFWWGETKLFVVNYVIADSTAVWNGAAWQLFTTIFAHGDVIHLLFNCAMLWRFGREVEEWLGPVRYAGLVVLLGVGASAAQFLASSSGGIGLSGVVYGLAGLLFAIRRYKDFAAILMNDQMVQMLVVWFFLCIALTYARVWSIANVAHGAGAVLGWLIGRAALARGRVWLLAGVALLVALLTAATQYMPWDGWYAIHQGNRNLVRHDWTAALTWFRRADATLRKDDNVRSAVREKIRELEGLVENAPGEGIP